MIVGGGLHGLGAERRLRLPPGRHTPAVGWAPRLPGGWGPSSGHLVGKAGMSHLQSLEGPGEWGTITDRA